MCARLMRLWLGYRESFLTPWQAQERRLTATARSLECPLRPRRTGPQCSAEPRLSRQLLHYHPPTHETHLFFF